MQGRRHVTGEKTACGTEAIRCPFFRKNEKTVITCEGLTDDSVIRLTYRSKKGREIQKKTFCQSRYENCEIYRAIMGAKYMEG